MQNSRELCFVSGNPDKVKEIKGLAPVDFNIYGLDTLDHDIEIDETGSTIQENSAIKAKFVFDKYHVPCFSDDTGLEVEALNGLPGVYSARYAGDKKDPEANIQLLLKSLEKHKNRKARFITVITYIDPSGNQHQFEGTVEGEILTKKRGKQGFGYDPIFLPNGESHTFAEMSVQDKNKISHRALAFKAFFSFLNSKG